MMKKLILTGIIAVLFMACGGSMNSGVVQEDGNKVPDTETYDPKRGEGKFTEVELGALDKGKADQGEKIYQTKCQSCHKLTDERLVGPGWAGVTRKHSSAWLLNFITNPDAMLDKDPHLLAQLEICLVRMPNQNLTDNDAYDIVEFMRENDGAK